MVRSLPGFYEDFILDSSMSKALPVVVAVVLAGAALVPIYYATQHPATELGTKADKNAAPVAKISYALGYEVAKQTPPELETGAFITGFRDARAQKPAAYTEEELQAAYMRGGPTCLNN